MTWCRFESGARAHAKCVKAGNEAAAFWAWAIMWSNGNGTDGYLDGNLLGAIPPVPIANDIAKALAEKCADAWLKPGYAGLFERVDGGYQVHDFHDFQPPKDEEEKENWLSAVRSKAGKEGARKRWQNRDGKRDGKTPTLAGGDARASDRTGSERVGSEDPEGSAEGGLREQMARAYADGIADASGQPWRMPDANIESAEILSAVTLYVPNLRGDKLVAWVKRSAATYRRAMADRAEFQRGFRPSKWLEWLNAGGEKMQRRVIGQPAPQDADALRSRPTSPDRPYFASDEVLAEKRRSLGLPPEGAANG